ncbi:MAG: DUF1048 domain-containing protein [Ruminococcus sp.]|nr:DUF1048 domain-containing protein [Ruminococcus sp.]
MPIVNSHFMYIEKLNPEYREVFKTVSEYVNSNNMDEMRTEETLSEVMDTFLAAQEAGKPVEKVVGKDLQKFCESLCSEKGVKTFLLGFIETLDFCFGIYTVLNLIDLISMIFDISDGEKINFFTYRSKTDLLPFLCGYIIFIIASYTAKYFRKKYMFTSIIKYKLISIFIFAFSLVFCFAFICFLLEDYNSENTYLWIGLLVSAVYLIFYRIITKDKRRFMKENCITFNEFLGISETFKNDMEEMEMKRFERLNKRNPKKGKPELTFEQFLDFEEKNCNNWDKKPPFYIALAMGFPVIVTVILRLMNGFEQTSDMWFFFFILLAVESLLMFGIYKAGKSGSNARMKWIEAKRKENQ